MICRLRVESRGHVVAVILPCTNDTFGSLFGSYLEGRESLPATELGLHLQKLSGRNWVRTSDPSLVSVVLLDDYQRLFWTDLW
jgi:hypothetical protein